MKIRVKANLKKAQRDIGIDPWGQDREVQRGDRNQLKELKSKVVQFAYQLLQSWGLAGKRIADLFTDPQLKKYSYKIRTEIENFLKEHNLLDTFKQNYGNNVSEWFAGPQPVIARSGKLHIKATFKPKASDAPICCECGAEMDWEHDLEHHDTCKGCREKKFTSKIQSEKATKCVDCDKLGLVKNMDENPDGAGYLCPSCSDARFLLDKK